VVFKSSEGMQRSGTGSQMKIGFGANGLIRFLFRRTELVRAIHLAGEHIR
jgi:hypothetical protein